MRFKFEAMNYQGEQEKRHPAGSRAVCSLPMTVESFLLSSVSLWMQRAAGLDCLHSARVQLRSASVFLSHKIFYLVFISQSLLSRFYF